MNNQSLEATEFVWHYTKMEFLPSIAKYGALIPKSEADLYQAAAVRGGLVSQVPFIWFSSDQNWEPLCTQLGGGMAEKSKTWQQWAYTHNAIRFGISPLDKRLLNWEKTCKAGGANREERRLRAKLAEKAKKFGSDATKWLTSTEEIPLNNLRFQMWFDNKWTDDEL